MLLLADGNISPGHTLYRALHLITNLSQTYLSSKSWFSKFLLREARIIVCIKVTRSWWKSLLTLGWGRGCAGWSGGYGENFSPRLQWSKSCLGYWWGKAVGVRWWWLVNLSEGGGNGRGFSNIFWWPSTQMRATAGGVLLMGISVGEELVVGLRWDPLPDSPSWAAWELYYFRRSFIIMLFSRRTFGAVPSIGLSYSSSVNSSLVFW